MIKQLLPPILYKRLRRMVHKPILEYAPDGWRTVLPNGHNTGWSVHSVVEAERAKWEMFKRNLEGTGPLGFSHEHTDLSVVRNRNFHNVHISFAYILALAAHKKDEISVLDWGGGLGHYYLVAKTVLPEVKVDYHIKEVPMMAEAGQQLNPEVSWYADESCLTRSYDVIMMNGSTPYMPDWKEALGRIIQSVDNYFFLTRQAVVQHNPTFVAIQSIYNSHMLHQQLNQSELLQVVQDTGLRLVREFVVADKPYIKDAPEQCELRGWLFKKG